MNAGSVDPSTYEFLLARLHELVGRELKSPGTAAGFIFYFLDERNSTLQLNVDDRGNKSRPLSEVWRIWSALHASPAVHVDSVLGGSSSSRNQPETIVASIPGVCYGIIDGRRHLVWVDEDLRPPGTLKELDPFHRVLIEDVMKHWKNSPIEVLSWSDPENAAETLGPNKVSCQLWGCSGYYWNGRIVLVRLADSALAEGWYPVLTVQEKVAGADLGNEPGAAIGIGEKSLLLRGSAPAAWLELTP